MDCPTQRRMCIESQLEHTDLVVLHGFVILNLFPIRNPLLCVESCMGNSTGNSVGAACGLLAARMLFLPAGGVRGAL